MVDALDKMSLPVQPTSASASAGIWLQKAPLHRTPERNDSKCACFFLSGSIRTKRSETSRDGGTPLFSFEFELSAQFHACFQGLMMFREARKALGNGLQMQGRV